MASMERKQQGSELYIQTAKFFRLLHLDSVPYKIEYYFKVSVLLVLTLVLCFYAILICPYYLLKGERDNLNYHFSVNYYKALQYVFGYTVEIEGEENLEIANKQASVLVANHQSALDVVWLARLVPKRGVFLAKHSIMFIPLLGFYLWLADNIFLKRKNKTSIKDMFKKAGKKLKEKDVGVIVFPEGTRYNDPEKAGMLPFKKGAFLLAKYAKCPIIPIVAMDLHNLYSDPHKWCVPGVIKIRVLPPIWLDQENSRTDAKESNNRNAKDSENSTSEAGRHPDTGVSVEKLMQDTWDLMYKNLLEISDPRMDIEALRSKSKKSV